jgi:hypothetical protein
MTSSLAWRNQSSSWPNNQWSSSTSWGAKVTGAQLSASM